MQGFIPFCFYPFAILQDIIYDSFPVAPKPYPVEVVRNKQKIVKGKTKTKRRNSFQNIRFDHSQWLNAITLSVHQDKEEEKIEKWKNIVSLASTHESLQ